MPIEHGFDDAGPYARWGMAGRRYHFSPNSPSSRRRAEAKARQQGIAIEAAKRRQDSKRPQKDIALIARGAERDLRRRIRKRLKRLRELVEKEVLRGFTDEGRREDAYGFNPATFYQTWVRLSAEPDEDAAKAADDVERVVDRGLKRAKKKAGVEQPDVAPLDLAGVSREVAGRIRDLEKDYVDRISKKLSEIAVGEASQADVEAILRERGGMALKKASLLARDVTGSMEAHVAKEKAREVGVPKYIWRTQRDDRVRPEHAAREGETFSWDSPPSDGHPGEPYNCLPATSVLDDGLFVEILYRHWFDGELTEIVTESGKTLSATPNHPVLTRDGWVPIKSVREGEHIFECRLRGFELLESNVQRSETTIGEAFETLAPFLRSVRVAGSGTQFHGDGSNHEVDIVDVNGGLPGGLDITLSQEQIELLFTEADRATPNAVLASLGSLPLCLQALWGAPLGIVSGASKIFALLGRHVLVTDEHRRTSVSRLDAALKKALPNSPSVYAQLFGESLLTGALEVGSFNEVCVKVLAVVRHYSRLAHGRVDAPSAEVLGQRVGVDAEHLPDVLQEVPLIQHLGSVVEHRVGRFAGHVYNLQTEAGWYIADGFPVHNCRCWAEPDVDSVIDDL